MFNANDESINYDEIYGSMISDFYRRLIIRRAGRIHSFIDNDERGFRHINNDWDKTGVTYAFWLLKENKYV